MGRRLTLRSGGSRGSTTLWGGYAVSEREKPERSTPKNDGRTGEARVGPAERQSSEPRDCSQTYHIMI